MPSGCSPFRPPRRRLLVSAPFCEDEQGPPPAVLPPFLPVGCCLSLLIFQVTRSLLLHQHLPPFVRSVQEVTSVHSFTLFASPSHIHFPQKAAGLCPSSESILAASEHQLLRP